MSSDLVSPAAAIAEDPIECLVTDGRRRELERRVERLQSGAANDRIQAAAALIEFGHEAVGPLCRALKDPDNRVRAAAAKALVKVGDARAVEPLTIALKESIPGRSGRRYALISMAPTVLGLLAIAAALAFPYWGQGRAVAYFVAVCSLLKILVKAGLRIQCVSHHFQKEAAEALVSIGERDPVPELRETLPDLRMLSKAALLVWEDRRAVGTAAARIDELTADLRTLPIAASRPEAPVHRLPRVAASGPTDLAELPRPADCGRS